MSNLIGQQLGQYKVISLLGKGGMATVYRARQESISRDVAVKVIKPDLAGAEMFVARFEREARTVASFSHPHILKVFDYGQYEDTVYLVIELMTGGSLSDLIEQQKALSIEMTVKMLDQISHALDYAHKRGVIHRDLKPQNVLLDDDQNAFLTDFGIAKVTSSGTGLTQSGIAMGTPSYMPPEQWRGETVDARADIYALGVMLFEMLTGRVPFQGDTPFSMMYKHLNDPPPALGTIRSDISSAVDAVIYQALAKNPEDRYESAAALSAAFKEALKGNVSYSDDPAFYPENGGPTTEQINVPSGTPVGSTRAPRGTPLGTTRPPSGTPAGSTRAPKGTPIGMTRPGQPSANTVVLLDEPAEQSPARRGLPIALIAVGVVAALLVIIGGVLVASSGSGNQNQTATAQQIALAATTISQNSSGTVTQAAIIAAGVADAATNTQIARSTINAGSVTVTSTPSSAVTTAAPISVAGLPTDTPLALTAATTKSSTLASVPPVLPAQISTASPSATVTASITASPSISASATVSQTPTPTLTLTATASSTFTPTITLTPSSTLTFTPAPPQLTGTSICATKTGTVSFTLRNVGGPASGTYIVVDSNGFSQDGTLTLLAGESTTLSFHPLYGVATLIATVNGATQQFTFAAQCGPKPTATVAPATRTPTSTTAPPTVAATDAGSLISGATASSTDITPGVTAIAALPANSKPLLAYIAKVNGRQGIYTINGDGTSQTALTNTNNSYSPPFSWSPDRSQIAFVLRTNTGESIWVMNADGTNVTRFAPTGSGTASFPAWSPDGQHIAFIGTINGRSELYVMNAVDGSEQHTITNIGVKTNFLAWGADSQHVFFLSNGVWVATIDGKAPIQINTDTRATDIEVSPNGYQLAVVSGTSIYLLDVQNKFAKTALVDNGSNPSWAPRGLQIVYSSGGAIYTLTIADGTPKKVADAGTQPIWSPTGRQIAYISGGALFVMGYEGTNPHQVAANAQSPAWAP